MNVHDYTYRFKVRKKSISHASKIDYYVRSLLSHDESIPYSHMSNKNERNRICHRKRDMPQLTVEDKESNTVVLDL